MVIPVETEEPATADDVVKIVLADDHELVRSGLRTVLEGATRRRLIGVRPTRRAACERS